MLSEISHVKQIQGEPKRRWFIDEFFDLYIWFDDSNGIVGFQLSYDKKRHCRALTWWQDKGYLHDKIDDGEGRPGQHKSTPILAPDGIFDKKAIADAFVKASAGLDEGIIKFISEKISAY